MGSSGVQRGSAHLGLSHRKLTYFRGEAANYSAPGSEIML